MAGSDELRAENEALRARVAALEAELEARPRVDRQPMLALLDMMPMQVAVIARDGTCEYVSPAVRPWLLRSRKETVGADFIESVIPSLRDAARELVACALKGEVVQREVILSDRDGRPRDLQVIAAPRRLGDQPANGCMWVAHDITPLRMADESLRASEERFRLAAEGAGLGVFEREAESNAVLFSPQARAMYGYAPEEPVTLAMLRASIHPDDRARVGVATQRAFDPEIRERAPCEYRIIRPDGEIRWVVCHAEGIFESQDGVLFPSRLVGLLQDVTDRTLAAHRQQLMLNELNHRVKNTLASVQSIVRLTLRDGQGLAGARDRLTERLMALASAHDLLTRESWETADLGEIVRASASPYDPGGAGRFRIAGPRVRVSPKAAVSLALALHELATNAAKYGALSNQTGAVSIDWRLEADGSRLVLDWREQGGPPVVPPQKTGFGTRLLTRGLTTEFGGVARLTYPPTGLCCRIEAPVGGAPRLDLV